MTVLEIFGKFAPRVRGRGLSYCCQVYSTGFARNHSGKAMLTYPGNKKDDTQLLQKIEGRAMCVRKCSLLNFRISTNTEAVFEGLECTQVIWDG